MLDLRIPPLVLEDSEPLLTVVLSNLSDIANLLDRRMHRIPQPRLFRSDLNALACPKSLGCTRNIIVSVCTTPLVLVQVSD